MSNQSAAVQLVEQNRPKIPPANEYHSAAQQLIGVAADLQAKDLHDNAISTLCTALMLDPAHVPVIHKIGQCLEAKGLKDAADLCYRGSLPEVVIDEYLQAQSWSNRLVSISEASNVEVLQAYPEEFIELQRPRRNHTEKQFGQFNYPGTTARASYCTVAADGGIWFDGFNTVAFDQNFNVLKEQVKGNEHAAYLSASLQKPEFIDGVVCFLDGRSSPIYYHWMLDIIPKLGVVEKSGIHLDEIDYFVVNAKSSFQLNSLKALGIDQDRILTGARTQHYQATKMIVPFLRNDLGERVYHGLGVGIASWVPRYLNRMHNLPENSDLVGSEEGQSRIYISRGKSGTRNIAGEPELVSLLENYGFRKVDFETMSLQEQASTMAGASCVVAVHGAGLTNLSYCAPGTQVVEIFGDYVVPCYWALSGVLGLDYYQFMGGSVHEGQKSSTNPGNKVSELRSLQVAIDFTEFGDFLEKEVL